MSCHTYSHCCVYFNIVSLADPDTGLILIGMCRAWWCGEKLRIKGMVGLVGENRRRTAPPVILSIKAWKLVSSTQYLVYMLMYSGEQGEQLRGRL